MDKTINGLTDWGLLESTLAHAIDEWMDQAAEGKEWIGSLVPPETPIVMAQAGIAVLKGIEASGKFTKSEMPR